MVIARPGSRVSALLVVAVGLFATGFAAPAAAGFLVDPATFGADAAEAPRVAVSLDHWTAVSFLRRHDGATGPDVAVQVLPTNPLTDEIWPDLVVLGPGTLHDVCWSRDGFTVAFARGDTVLAYQSDLYGAFDLDHPLVLAPGGEVIGLDLWGAPTDAAGHAVFLVVDTDNEPGWGEDCTVTFASRSSYYGWSAPETVTSGVARPPHSQVTWFTGPAGPWPAVYWLDDWFVMKRRVRETTGWAPPVVISGDGSGMVPFAGPFDVARSLDTGFIGLGDQPTCPCGTVHFFRHDNASGWQPPVEVTVGHEYYDWPMDPHIAMGWDGVMHVMWYQLGSQPDMTAHAAYLEYWTVDDGEWTDAGGFLDGVRMGVDSRTDVGVSPDGVSPVLAWSKIDTIAGAPLPERVFVARPDGITAAPDEVPAAAAATLSAAPNPFNPCVTLTVSLPAAAAVRVEVFDARGRRVRRVFAGALDAGQHALSWDGRDDAGAAMAGGVYVARVGGDGGVQAARKLVLAP